MYVKLIKSEKAGLALPAGYYCRPLGIAPDPVCYGDGYIPYRCAITELLLPRISISSIPFLFGSFYYLDITVDQFLSFVIDIHLKI